MQLLWKTVLGAGILATVGVASFGAVTLASALDDEPGLVQLVDPVVTTSDPAGETTDGSTSDGTTDSTIEPGTGTPVVVPPAGSQDIVDTDDDDDDDSDDSDDDDSDSDSDSDDNDSDDDD